MITESLMGNSALKSLDLKDNAIGDEGTKELMGALKKTFQSWTFLGLEMNSIGDKGAGAIVDALDHGFSLEQLNLAWYNDVSAELLASLAERIPTCC
jgi:Ran GTPase-activating protein (RanGAP) involved in mRNA processing and transport